jgi:transcriptional regulator with PAS, ATPase and Fis domain
MKYLIYFKDGFLKKIPLFEKETIIGRENGVDYRIDDPTISRKHAKVVLENNHIKVYDLNSSNGLFYDGIRVKKATLKLNNSFQLAGIEFFLKEGDTEEFKLSKKDRYFLEKFTNAQTMIFDKTEKAFTIFDKTLNYILQLGLKGFDFENIFSFIITPLENIFEEGYLLFIKKTELGFDYLTRLRINTNNHIDFDFLNEIEKFFLKSQEVIETKGKQIIYSFPVKLGKEKGALIFLSLKENPISLEKTSFLEELADELSLIYKFYSENDKNKEQKVEIITKSNKLLELLKKIKKIAKENINILIEGETGVGKELVAKFIHYNSKQKKGNYIGINCSAIPENLLEDELFGHEKGAFSGAYNRRKGKLELASEGTLVLDEISEMPISLQTKLLRVLQEEEFYRLGGNTPIKISLRIIALSNKNILKLVEGGEFRKDLYYRIAHFTFEIPPLRKRKEDIECLTKYFIKKFSSKEKKIKGITKSAIEILKEYSWPGNIRELENTIKALIGFSENGDIIDRDRIVNEIPALIQFKKEENTITPTNEKEIIIKLLKNSKWNKSTVAKKLGISRTSLYKKLKKHSIN